MIRLITLLINKNKIFQMFKNSQTTQHLLNIDVSNPILEPLIRTHICLFIWNIHQTFLFDANIRLLVFVEKGTA